MIRCLLSVMAFCSMTWSTVQANDPAGPTYAGMGHHMYEREKGSGRNQDFDKRRSVYDPGVVIKDQQQSLITNAASQPVDVVYRNLGFEAAFKELVRSFETDFKPINLGAMEKGQYERYAGVRYHTDIRIPGCTNSYLELVDIKKNKTFISNSVPMSSKQEVIALYNKIKDQFDKIDFGKLDLVEDDMTTTLPSQVLQMASYKALGMDPDLSEKMREIQVDIQLKEDLTYDITQLSKPPVIKYYVSVRVGQQ